MMGRREDGQGLFFYAFDLDEVVPPDHLVRQIDDVLDLSWVHKELSPYYSQIVSERRNHCSQQSSTDFSNKIGT